MTNFKQTLLKLTENLNILREREARYGGNPPLELLNQIADHEQAIALTQQVLAGQLTEAGWHEATAGLLLALPEGQVINLHQVDTGGGAYVAGQVNTAGGDFVGRDHILRVTGDRMAEVIRWQQATDLAIMRYQIEQQGGVCTIRSAPSPDRIGVLSAPLPPGEALPWYGINSLERLIN
jgi:hypothetical protein